MIIDLRTILRGSRHFEFFLDQDRLRGDKPDHPGFKLDRPLTVKADLYKAGDKFILEGWFQGEISIDCDRCLEPFHHDLKVRFRSVLALISGDYEEEDKELIEEDLDIDIIKADIIDLADLIREQIYLNLPMKRLCRDDCRGLCPKCGINLNLKKCACKPDQGHPGFQKLKALKLNNR